LTFWGGLRLSPFFVPKKETSYLSSRAWTRVCISFRILCWCDAQRHVPSLFRPISLFKSSTGIELPHHVDNVLPSMFWNKSWLEQNLEQVKPCRIK